MATYLTNAFSLQMLETDQPHTIHTAPMTITETVEALRGDYTSAIGHVDTAAVVSGLFGTAVPCQRINVRLVPGDTLYVAQLTGGRLPEGATTLPEGFAISFQRVTVD